MPHFKSKQTLIRDIKLSAAPKLFMHHSWSLFVLQLGAEQGTPKAGSAQAKSLINKVRLTLFFIKNKGRKRGRRGEVFSVLKSCRFCFVCLSFVFLI